MKTMQKIVYVADDGKQFDTEFACRKWENRVRPSEICPVMADVVKAASGSALHVTDLQKGIYDRTGKFLSMSKVYVLTANYAFREYTQRGLIERRTEKQGAKSVYVWRWANK